MPRFSYGKPQDSRRPVLRGLLTVNDFERGVDWRQRFGVSSDKDPDYLIERVDDRAIVEVKHFETRRMKDRFDAASGRTMYFGGRRPMRSSKGPFAQRPKSNSPRSSR